MDGFDTELHEMKQLIEMEDFPQLEHVTPSGMVQHMSVPNLQEATGTFEQFVSTLRKERRKADEQFVQETIKVSMNSKSGLNKYNMWYSKF